MADGIHFLPMGLLGFTDTEDAEFHLIDGASHP